MLWFEQRQFKTFVFIEGWYITKFPKLFDLFHFKGYKYPTELNGNTCNALFGLVHFTLDFLRKLFKFRNTEFL